MAATIEALKAEKAAKPTFGKFGTPRPAEPGGIIPRVIDGVERAEGTGAKRFKVCARPGRKVAVTGMQFPVRYVLALTPDDAIGEYRRAIDFDGKMATASKHYDEPLTESCEFVVTELAD